MRVCDLLTDPSFSELELLAGSQGKENAIASVTVVDTPDGAQWLTGGEFVITTGYMVGNNPDSQAAFLRILSQKKAAGLGIKKNRHISAISDAVLQLADQLPMPLVSIPEHYSFVDIINPVLTRMVNHQYALLAQNSLIHDKFQSLAINDSPVPEILQTLSLIVGVPSAFVDTYFREIYYADKTSTLAQSMDQIDPADISEALLENYDTYLVAKQGARFGYIFFPRGELKASPDNCVQTAVEQAGTILILRMQTRISNQYAVEKYKGNFIEDILLNNIKKESEINAAKEDTMKNDTVVESVLEDTVQWVESKTLPPSYREVGKDKITNPETVAYSGNFLRMAAIEPTETTKPTAEPTAAPTTEPTTAPTASPSVSPSPTPAATPTAVLEPTSVTVAVEAKATSQIKVTNYTGTATYKVASKDDKIATASVDANGKITVQGVAAGDTTVTATVTMGSATKTLNLAVKVTAKMAITLDKTAVTVYPKSTATVTATVSGSGTVTASSSDTNIATVSVNGKTITITGVKAGSATITAVYKEGNSEVKATCTVKVGTSNPREDKNTVLKDTSGKELYVSDGNNEYRLAHYADYYTASKFYIKEATRYTGWQTLDGKVYFFKADGDKVTGEQVIQGAKYNFASDGSLVVGSGTMGIDVSKWNGTIDWNAVKNSGVSYVIIRVGYRGSSQGALIEDPKFKTNIKGATAAGIKVGVYFFTQAVDEVEAVQEASMVLDRISGYKISYPVFLDVEGSGGRGDAIDSATRTAVCKAFCNTIKNAGYTPGIYANKTWLSSKMDAGALSGYKIWLAQYAKTPTYTGRYDLWQYRSNGKVSGISGNVDLNLSYLGY